RRLAVRPGQFVILNDDQPYSCHIDHERTRTLSVFFKKEFASSVFQDVLQSDEALLDDPAAGAGMPEFFQTLSPIDAQLQRQLSGLVSFLDANGYDRWKAEEDLVFLLRHLIYTHQSEARRSNKIMAVKASTKRELYKRLCIARDMLHSFYREKADLESVSLTACLSVPQLIRQFKSVFDCTPHQYLIQIRLRHAAELLKSTDKPVHEITWQCGFENTSAFCRAFKSAFGVKPGDLRE
ncbi:MAG TPA: AraC family transcriptional regulator, partial [Cyclobacteriaceae bacterium]|nr:AraC family transcriptional regulator [Cyclobacteriaceae bacterium]